MSKYTLSSYEPMDIRIPKPPIPKEMIADELRRRLEPYYTFEAIISDKRVVQAGDYLMITIENAQMDGNDADMFNGEDKLYKMGTGDMPASFDDMLLGMKPGETKRAIVGMDSSLAPDGRMSMISLETTVVRILKATPPELTDEFVAENFPPCTTADEFLEKVRSEFTLSDPVKDDRDYMSRIVNVLLDRLEQVPDDAEVRKYGSMIDARIACAIDAFADHLGIELTEDEVINLMPAETPENKVKIYEKFVQSGRKDDAYSRARQMTVLNWLHDKSTIAYETEEDIQREAEKLKKQGQHGRH